MSLLPETKEELVPSLARLSMDTDALLAKELNKLTMEEREQVYYDVHGVANDIEETPEMIQQKLSELQAEIDQIALKTAYEKALAEKPDYVHDETFRLMFLRAESFQAGPAAERLVRFLETKLKLFGNKLLAKPIRIQDLEKKDDQAVLKCGMIQMLPLPDRAGRPVLVWTTMLRCGTEVNRVSIYYLLFEFLLRPSSRSV